MQYDVQNPSQYLEALEDDWRKQTVNELRSLIQSIAPDLSEQINYKMLGYCDDKGFVFHLNAQKNFVGLYVGNIDKIDPQGQLLKGLNKGKGCIRLKKSNKIENTKIAEFLKETIRLWHEGSDIGC